VIRVVAVTARIAGINSSKHNGHEEHDDFKETPKNP
jgi:hypothetical protein